MPELPEFCDGLRNAILTSRQTTSVHANFALMQILAAGAKLDMSNEHGRVVLEEVRR